MLLNVNRIGKDNFRLMAAYLLPGITVLWALSWHVPVIASWLATTEGSQPTVGGFLYVTFAALAAGLTVSTVRWATIDSLHHWTGLRPPPWDFSLMNDKFSAYQLLESNHYHYYQWHANMLVALCFALFYRRWGDWWAPVDVIDGAGFALSVILFVGSRDTLRKYYTRVSMLLNSTPEGLPDEPIDQPPATQG